MPNGHGAVREIAWHEVFPWLLLLRAFRLALGFRVLLLSTVALLAVVAGWRLIGEIFFQNTTDEPLRQAIAAQNIWPWETSFAAPRALPFAGEETAARTRLLPVVGPYLAEGPVVRTWSYLSRPFCQLFSPQTGFIGLLYWSLCCLWAALVWGFFAGAITRIMALALTRGENLGLGSAIRHAQRKLGAYFLAPLMPLLGAFAIGLVLALLGLLMRADVGVFLAGLLWPLVLVAGVLLAILLLGLLFGWPLMWPTISTEGTDAFDALSRSYAYVYQRPLHYVLYAFLLSLIGLAGVVLVNLFAGAVIELSNWGVSWGVGAERGAALTNAFNSDEPSALSGLAMTGGRMIRFWIGLVTLLALAFQFTFFWASATAIYLLLRRQVDAAEMDDIYLEDQEESPPLPPLTTDAEGAPQTQA